MITLFGYSSLHWDEEPFVARVTTHYDRPAEVRSREILVLRASNGQLPEGFHAYLSFEEQPECTACQRLLRPPVEMDHLTDGDIVRVTPQSGHIFVLYRCRSFCNTIFLTEQCNSRCVMCPQPPCADRNDWTEIWLEALSLMSPDTALLGISGGEPTLLPDRLLEMVAACKTVLPKTALHVLTNGRMFNYMSLCKAVAAAGHPDLLFGIPLYADLPFLHDFIVQRKNAFDQTVRGIMNLRRCGQRIEIRVVLLRQNIERSGPSCLDHKT